MYSLPSVFGLLPLISTVVAVFSGSLPTVDLGYQVHQALTYNSSTTIYNFTNIPYAQPPVGPLRFAAPLPLGGRIAGLQNGSVGKICPQVIPAWQTIGLEFVEAVVTGDLPFNFSAADAALKNASSTPVVMDPRTTEDCLVLDVLVPKAIFEARQHVKSKRRRTPMKGAPVLVWIYGGGYTYGTKELYGDPSGLITAARTNGQGIIYVAMNYRVGAFGFLSGPTLQSNGTANAGFYDQRLAIEWVKMHIAKFGGDPEQITIMGESAGGGSVMHQITAFGGQMPVAFQRAVPQSPAFVPITSNAEQETTFQDFLALLNVSSLQATRDLPSSALIEANYEQIVSAPYGTYVYGPAVDGIFVPSLPGTLLAEDAFAKDVHVMAGHNSDEGLLFADPRINNDTGFEQYIRSRFPDIGSATVEYILNVLYPARYDGSQPYMSFMARYVLFLSDVFFTCNTNFLVAAATKQSGYPGSYTYEFAVPPGIHGQDLAYTFYDGPSTSVTSELVAEILQQYIVSFATTGIPSSHTASGVPFPSYGRKDQAVVLNVTGSSVRKDPTANARCAWWQKALYF